MAVSVNVWPDEEPTVTAYTIDEGTHYAIRVGDVVIFFNSLDAITQFVDKIDIQLLAARIDRALEGVK